VRRFLIDTDTASDDAVAILMALRTPDVVVEAITIVAGNVAVEQGATNALYTVELCGREVPVYKGLARPLLRPHVDARFFHGMDGMGDLNLPAPRQQPQAQHAVPAIIDTIRAAPGEITLVTLGPLSNVAAALVQAPDIAPQVKEAYVMGGAANVVGNITPAAEYNIWCDPEAAKIVFHSGMPITMVGWELALGPALLVEEDMQRLRALGTPYADFALDTNRRALQSCRQWLGLPGMTLCDPVAMAVALDRRLCTHAEKKYVDVETTSELTRGETVVDRFGVLRQEPNLEVCLAIDAARFKAMLFDRVS
jgi:purine nucleosidase